MSDMKCPLGEDCDLTLAWMMGAERAKDTIKAQAAEIERLRAALREISERHVPDQPSCLDIDEADYVRRQHTELRRIARAALEGK